MEQTNGSVFGLVTTWAAISIDVIPVDSITQTAFLSGFGALVGFVVTYALKKGAAWMERKLK